MNTSPAPLSRFLDRRGFIRTAALTGSAVHLVTSKTAVAQQTAAGRTIKCALIGCGAQGKALRIASKDVPGIQWVAMCDIWKYSIAQTRGGFLTENKHQVDGEVKIFEDVEEMLTKQTDIEAVFIATPDFLHAPISRLCLSKGKQVYCEKMMSNSLEGALDMAKAGKEFGDRVFQIGHQRHSSPRYINLRENIIKKGLLGRVTHCYAQWNRGVSGSQPLSHDSAVTTSAGSPLAPNQESITHCTPVVVSVTVAVLWNHLSMTWPRMIGWPTLCHFSRWSRSIRCR